MGIFPCFENDKSCRLGILLSVNVYHETFKLVLGTSISFDEIEWVEVVSTFRTKTVPLCLNTKKV